MMSCVGLPMFEPSSRLRRRRINQDVADKRLAGITGGDDDGLLANPAIVIETVFEDLALKRAVFKKRSAVCRADAALATNTSYLDPNAISQESAIPSAFWACISSVRRIS